MSHKVYYVYDLISSMRIPRLIYISTKREVAMMTNTVKEFLAKEGEPALGGGKNSRKVISFYQTHLHHSFHLV